MVNLMLFKLRPTRCCLLYASLIITNDFQELPDNVLLELVVFGWNLPTFTYKQNYNINYPFTFTYHRSLQLLFKINLSLSQNNH